MRFWLQSTALTLLLFIFLWSQLQFYHSVGRAVYSTFPWQLSESSCSLWMLSSSLLFKKYKKKNFFLANAHVCVLTMSLVSYLMQLHFAKNEYFSWKHNAYMQILCMFVITLVRFNSNLNDFWMNDSYFFFHLLLHIWHHILAAVFAKERRIENVKMLKKRTKKYPRVGKCHENVKMLQDNLLVSRYNIKGNTLLSKLTE